LGRGVPPPPIAEGRVDGKADFVLRVANVEASGDGDKLSSHVDTHRTFARGEMIRLCQLTPVD